MGQFLGTPKLGDTFYLYVGWKGSTNVPADADNTPIYRIYGPAGTLVTTGTLSKHDTGTITGATNATPIVITSASHGLLTGTRVTITSVGGNTAANATWTITRVDANTFSLDTSVGNGAYTSGGTWHVTGLYRAALVVSAGNGFEAGGSYAVYSQATISSAVYADLSSFSVL